MESTTKEQSSVGNPAADRPRIVAIDVLRGFALLGIVGANIVLYDIDSLAEIEPAFATLSISLLGAPFMFFSLVFVINKMMAVFSMLFGAGVLMATDRSLQQTGRSWPIYFRRNLILMAIGVAHMLIWVGDILLLYAVCSLVLYFLRKLSPQVLISIAMLVWYWAPVIWLLFGIGPHGDEYFSRALSMMLFGMGLYRIGIINGERSVDWYRKSAIISLCLGLPFVTFAWLSQTDASALNNLGVPAVAFGYVCSVMWICKTDFFLLPRRWLAAAGQMALTNYLAQTLLGICFYALLKLSGFAPSATLMGWGMLGIWAIQLCWSMLWLKYFRIGPLEWAWRVATYSRLMPILRGPQVSQE